ncbi:acyltransferase [Flexibacterium corallicola]|uniref:acyltransferase n=1 Tax=Flexibacterium corallicola TaxID=3037259 RepID=UPI00286F7A0D|nr:acyltransferase [Pseudovibrio sp. M1P-2-3]
MQQLQQFKEWLKKQDHPAAAKLFKIVKLIKSASVPTIPWLHNWFYQLSRLLKHTFFGFIRIFWTTPLFQSQLTSPAPQLFIYGGMPLVLGNLNMDFGRDVRISGQTTLSARSGGQGTPQLSIGSNVDIGWQTTIAVGRRVKLGDNVRMAGRNFLAGYPGHPLNPEDRAKGLPETEDQVGDIILEDGVWLATGVIVSAGVTIGAGTVVAAGSVVTKDLPPRVLAAGVPAKVIRYLDVGKATQVQNAPPSMIAELPEKIAVKDIPSLPPDTSSGEHSNKTSNGSSHEA